MVFLPYLILLIPFLGMITSFHTSIPRYDSHRHSKLIRRFDISAPTQFGNNRCRLQSTRSELDGEENMVALFERAVVLQRSGSHDEALSHYIRFIKAAKQCNVSPEQYAEVYVNMGAIETRLQHREMAQHYFEQSIKIRPIGKAHVNLALLALQAGSKTTDPQTGMEALEKARGHCKEAISLDDEQVSTVTATKLLGDIKGMLSQMKR